MIGNRDNGAPATEDLPRPTLAVKPSTPRMIRAYGSRIVSAGSALPERVVTNHDLARIIETNHDWIVQRTGIGERRFCNPAEDGGTTGLSTLALKRALDAAGLEGKDLDLIIVATITGEMTCPSTACRVAANLNAIPTGAFDIVAACSGFVFGLNVADSLIRLGRYRRVGVIGCDTLSQNLDMSSRKATILFGDGAGAVVLERDDDDSFGCIEQRMYSDGSHWSDIYIPVRATDVPEGADWCEVKLGTVQMNGQEVYRFAVSRLEEVIVETMERSGLSLNDVKFILPHQSNLRIIEHAKRRLKLSDDKVYTNIERVGNTSGGSVGLLFDELWNADRIQRGDIILMIGVGAGMTWGTSLWRV